jgi:raffinose/stachyose/melibiose transport system substrate-binding protein
VFEPLVDFEMGAFPPPVPAEGDTCYISDHTDIGIGMNANTENAEAARTFLEWVGSTGVRDAVRQRAARLLPAARTAEIRSRTRSAQEFISWRDQCESSIRSTYAILSRGTPNLENETWNASANVINGTETPADAAARLQAGLESWYQPGPVSPSAAPPGAAPTREGASHGG